MKTRTLLSLILIASLSACSFPGNSPAPTTAPTQLPASPVSQPTALPTSTPTGAQLPEATAVLPTSPLPATLAPTLALATETSAPAPTTTFDLPDEAILIQEPAPGSRLLSPVHIVGIADSTFEQHLGINILDANGALLATAPATIQTPMGQRGPFVVDVSFTTAEEQPGFIQVFASSARDGGVTHLSSTGVTLLPSGSPEIRRMESQAEQILISQPVVTQQVSGGTLHVEGIGVASFEQSLLVEVYDANNQVVGSLPIVVSAPEIGQPGQFSADVPYNIAFSQPGRLVVRDVSPAFGGNVHLASVEINLNP